MGNASIDLVIDRERAPQSVLALSPRLEIAARRRHDLSGPGGWLSLLVHQGWLESILTVPWGDPARPEVYEVFPPPGDFDPPQASRPLTVREREILDFLLSVDVPGVEELRSQADFVVARRWSDTDASLYLSVDRERAPRAVLDHLVIETGSRTGQEPGDRYFQLSLWVQAGWLDEIEIIPYDDDPWPEMFPPPSDFEPPVKRGGLQ